ncbi:hypothetical protein PF006_g26676 [Phytophthora fragariae]|uniref:Uncharacterized protein n=1 Tax=Phytophthora fragariae TaxID=53985 RepID=A0A6A3QUE6_9STRA|nr:hypothetical protein PF006_g26676 [Phytophthora fragariae]
MNQLGSRLASLENTVAAATTLQAAATTTFSTPATVNDAAVTPLTSPLGHAKPVRPRRDAATARPSDTASAAMTPAEEETTSAEEQTTSAPAAASWQQQIAALLAAMQPPEQQQYSTASLATRASHASPVSQLLREPRGASARRT